MALDTALSVFQELIEYIEHHHVFDKLCDSGCGYIDSHRSERFQHLLERAKQALDELRRLGREER